MSRRRINSTLEDYFFQVRKLVVIFCDSCAGQNKKYTAIKFFHHTVCEINVFTAQKRCSRFVVISVWNADRDIWEKLVINLIPNYLTTGRMSFNKAAKKPTPFNVIDCAVEVEFKTWTDHVSDSYPTKCLISKRPIRMLLVEKKKNPQFAYRESVYNGPYLSAVITRSTNKRNRRNENTTKTRRILRILCNWPPTFQQKKAKLSDLLHLKRFLTSTEARRFCASLTSDEARRDEDIVECADNQTIDKNVVL